VSLLGAKIGGNLDMTSVHVDGKLNLGAVQIGGDLLLRCCQTRSATFKDIDLVAARISGGVDLTGAQVTGLLNMPSAQVGETSSPASRDGRCETVSLATSCCAIPTSASSWTPATRGLRLASAGSCALSTALKWGAGYGIGYYSFRVLFWLAFYSLLGAAIL
jgi:hypothetical protein